MKQQVHIKPNDWDSHITHPLQSWEWGEFRKAMGIETVRINNFQLTFHKLPKLPYTIGYFPKGPKPDVEMITLLRQVGKDKNAVFIQLEPNVLSHQASRQSFEGLVPSHHPLFTKYTFVLDLTKTEEQLLKDMHSKTRYNIKIAQKHNVQIREDSSKKAFKEYLELNEGTTKRQGFYAHTPLYHQKLWDILHPKGIANLWTATYQNKTLASWVIFCFGDTIYYPYGASSREHREVMAPTVLLWEIALWGKKHGYKKFDLWGAMGPHPDRTDSWYGFHRFKEGFKPEMIEFLGSYDLIINPYLYKLYCIADTIRWRLLKTKR